LRLLKAPDEVVRALSRTGRVYISSDKPQLQITFEACRVIGRDLTLVLLEQVKSFAGASGACLLAGIVGNGFSLPYLSRFGLTDTEPRTT